MVSGYTMDFVIISPEETKEIKKEIKNKLGKTISQSFGHLWNDDYIIYINSEIISLGRNYFTIMKNIHIQSMKLRKTKIKNILIK